MTTITDAEMWRVKAELFDNVLDFGAVPWLADHVAERIHWGTMIALSLVPLALYFKDGRVKVELALARGRKRADKRQTLAERDAKMDIARAMGRRAKGKD